MSERNLLDSVISWFSPSAGLERDRARAQSKRITSAVAKYDAASHGRRNTFFMGADTSVNAEIGPALTVLRGRSRELVRNNPYASKAVDVIVSNVIGSGIVPTAKASNSKKKKLADELMAEWMQHCDFHGRLDFYGLQALMMRAETESGEAVIIRSLGRSKARVPLTLKLREGDYIDHMRSIQEQNGAYIRHGVQFNTRGEISGYWIYNNHPGDMTGMTAQSELMQASQVIHVYEMRRPEQVRGIPRGVAGFQRMKLLDDFQDARLEQQKAAACLVGIIRDDENDSNAGDVLPAKLEPGMFPQLGYGKDVTFNNPPSTSGHAEFTSIEQRAIASAYGITYEALTGDLSSVNFSSGKMGWVEFSRNIDRWRWNMVIPALKKIETWFIEAANLAGYDLSGVTFEWTPPRREMIDPTREIPAQVKAIRAGLKSWQETARENGYDPALLADELAEDNALFDKLGIVVDSDARKTAMSGQFQVETNQTETTAEE